MDEEKEWTMVHLIRLLASFFEIAFNFFRATEKEMTMKEAARRYILFFFWFDLCSLFSSLRKFIAGKSYIFAILAIPRMRQIFRGGKTVKLMVIQVSAAPNPNHSCSRCCSKATRTSCSAETTATCSAS